MGRVQAGWLLGQVTAKGHGRGMRRQAQSERGATDTSDAERRGLSALPPAARVWCSTLASRLPSLARKTRKKITPIMQARFVVNVVRGKGFLCDCKILGDSCAK